MLYAPRDTYDGAAEDESEDEVCKSYLPPPEQYPKDVEYYLQAACFVASFGLEVMPEGPKRECTNFEELYAEGDTDDGDAHD